MSKDVEGDSQAGKGIRRIVISTATYNRLRKHATYENASFDSVINRGLDARHGDADWLRRVSKNELRRRVARQRERGGR